MGKPTEEFQYQTRRLQGQGNSEVYATLLEGRVIIEKKFESPEAARREEEVTRELAVRRDEEGHALSNNDFVFFTTVALQGDKAAIRMDTMAGWTLAEYRDRWLAGGRPWPDDYPEGAMPVRVYLLRVLEAIRETAFALERVHHNRIPYLHCDIKPGNLWIVAGQHPTDRMAGIRIIDFGSAVSLSREDPDTLTPDQLLERYRHVCGTPGFWSPRLSRLYRDMNALSEAVWSESPRAARLAEACRADLRALTPADDFYSLTATLFWALTGETAEGKTADGVGLALEQSLAGVPSDVREALTAFVAEELALCGGEEEGRDGLSPFRHFLQGLEQVEELARSEDIRPETLSRGVESWWEAQDECPFPEDAGLISDKPWTEPENLEDLPQGIPGVEFVLDESVRAFCLEGEAGSGKTSILLCALDQLLKERHQIPLYLPLESFDPYPDWLLRELCTRYLPRATDPARAVEQLRRMLSGEGEDRFTLLLDGTEQIPPEDQAAFCRMVEQWSACPRVRLVAAGRRVPELGLPRFYLVPGQDSLEGLEPAPPKASWYVGMTAFRLGQVAWLPAARDNLWLENMEHRPVTAVGFQAAWLFGIFADSGHTAMAEEFFLTTMAPLCCRMVGEDTLTFSAEGADIPGDFLQWLKAIGICKPAGGGRFVLSRRLRDFLAAVWCAAPEHPDALPDLLRRAKGDLTGLVYDLAELSPLFARVEQQIQEGTPWAELDEEACTGMACGRNPRPRFFLPTGEVSLWTDFLNRIYPKKNALKRLFFELLRQFSLPGWQEKGRLMFEGWAYSQWGDLSRENLKHAPADLFDLCHARLTSAYGEAILPRMELRQIAMLDIPEEILWMDCRDGCLLLTSPDRVTVVEPDGRSVCLREAGKESRVRPVWARFEWEIPEDIPEDITEKWPLVVRFFCEGGGFGRRPVQGKLLYRQGKEISPEARTRPMEEVPLRQQMEWEQWIKKQHPRPGVWISSDGRCQLSLEKRLGRIRLMRRDLRNPDAPAEKLWECGVPGYWYETPGRREQVEENLWLTARQEKLGILGPTGGELTLYDGGGIQRMWKFDSPDQATAAWMRKAVAGWGGYAEPGAIVLTGNGLLCECRAADNVWAYQAGEVKFFLLDITPDGQVRNIVALPELEEEYAPEPEAWEDFAVDPANCAAMDGEEVYFCSAFFPSIVLHYHPETAQVEEIRHNAPVKAIVRQWSAGKNTGRLVSVCAEGGMSRWLSGERGDTPLTPPALLQEYGRRVFQREGTFRPFVARVVTGPQLDAAGYFEKRFPVKSGETGPRGRYALLRQTPCLEKIRIARVPALCCGGSMEDFARQCAEELDENDLTRWLPLVGELSPGEVETFRRCLEGQMDFDANILWLEREDIVSGKYAARLSGWEKEGMPCDLLVLDLTKDLMLPEDAADIVSVLEYFDRFSLIGSHALILTGKEGDRLADLLGEALAGQEEPS